MASGSPLQTKVSPRIALATFPEDGKTKIELLHALDDAIFTLRNASSEGVIAANKGFVPLTDGA